MGQNIPFVYSKNLKEGVGVFSPLYEIFWVSLELSIVSAERNGGSVWSVFA